MLTRARAESRIRSHTRRKQWLLAFFCCACLSLAVSSGVSFQLPGSIAPPQNTNCLRDSLPPDESPQYFPAESFGVGGAFTASRYSCYLRAMQETPLLGSTIEGRSSPVYRLTVIPAFRPPFMVRLTISADRTGTLAIKSAVSQGSAGALTIDRTVELPGSQVNYFLTLVGRADFWSMPTVEVYSKDPHVIVKFMDGVDCVLEGYEGERYHVVTRTSPRLGPYFELTSYLFRNLARLSLPPGPTVPAKR